MFGPGKQRGMTAIGWLLTILVAGIFAFALLKLIPVYFDGYKISASMESLANDSASRGKNPRELQRDLLKRLDINMIYAIKAEDIGITRSSDGGYSIEIDYEPRIHFIGNLYFVAVFDKTVVVPGSAGS
ncbi:MAG: DUF4845 domain-containing protein [Gammaproteobacteria bacterium]|jgi:hypothetical protein